MNVESDYTRKKLTKFLCQELLYEFVTHNLDHAREKEVTDYLETCRDSQRELDNLSKGLRFALIGAKVRVSPTLLHALENFEPRWKRKLRVWTLWSSRRGWRALPYVFMVAVLATGIMVVRPWVTAPSEDITLAEQLKQEPDMLPQPAGAVPEVKPPPVEPLVMKPEETPATAEAATEPVPEIQFNFAELNDAVMRDLLPMSAAFKPEMLLAKVEPPPPAQAVADAGTAADPAPTAETKSSTPAVEEAMGRGYLFRTVMQVQDFQNSWPAIRDKIVALGGKVAGNVELGWLRRPDEAYFHFTLPESNMNELEIFLATFGPVQFSKDRHPRVMPEGQIRIIMSVKDGITQNEAPAETP